MKNALIKDSIKEIKHTYKRFLSILLMAFLGVGFFAGIRAASPDMLNLIDKYYKQQNVYDIQILSTLGLTAQDLEEISKIENVENVYASYETDGKIEIDNKEIIAKLIDGKEINKPFLLDGKLPENNNECLVEESFLVANNKKIGDIIELKVEDSTLDNGEKIQYLKNNQMKIVGTAQSPLYISRERGNSKLGAGKVNYYIYISTENINAKDIYTSIYVKVKNSEKYTTSTNKYEDYIKEVKNKIEKIKEERELLRKQQLINIAQEKINETENELNNRKNDAQEKIDEAEKQIQEARNEIEKVEKQIIGNKTKTKNQFANAEKEIEKAKSQIQLNEKELKTKEEEANKRFEQLELQKQQLQTNLEQSNNVLIQLQNQYNIIVEKLKDATLTEIEKNTYEQQKIYLENQIISLQQTIQTIQSGIKSIDTGIEKGKQEIQQGKQQIEKAKEEIKQNESILSKTKKTAYKQIEEAQKEIETAKQKLKNGEEELKNNKQEFETKISEAEIELLDAKGKIKEVKNPKWYILNRNSNSGYVSFIQDTKSIENIGKVFPIVFFAVATLISLTSMTRMIEEQRMQIGTLKALGYSKLQIISKYILYASLASLIGGITGMSIGFVLLPPIVWNMYEIMYQIPYNIKLKFYWDIGGLGISLICICIIGATIYSAIKELKSMPSVLMRPKSPKNGNRVLLEKVKFIWKRLNFSHKVTIRNIFRYKKRFLMTIIGILGCTSLILTGFGLKDSIKTILPNQYEKVFNYDIQINIKDELEESEKQEFITTLENKEQIEKAVETLMLSAQTINGEKEEDVQIVIPKDEFQGLINIKDIKTKEEIKLKDNEICLTDKVAQLLNVKSGNKIRLKDSNEKEYEVTISNIVENYVSHYVYMSKTMYEEIYGNKYSTNVILTQNKELNEEQEEEIALELMNQKEVSTITRISTMMKTLDNTLKSLDYIVLILIISAGLLAFVVLYNLANVNISERIRELATIKVLGFYDNEVYNYIGRETIILTAIGITLGLISGYFLNYYIMGTCEINILRFSKIIQPISYVYAVIITIVFTIIVNIATYFALKKINMIESLKSVE